MGCYPKVIRERLPGGGARNLPPRFGAKLLCSRRKKPGEDLIALPGQGEIFLGDSPFIVRGEPQCHLVEADVDVRMVVDFLGFPGNPVHESDTVQESFELECPKN